MPRPTPSERAAILRELYARLEARQQASQGEGGTVPARPGALAPPGAAFRGRPAPRPHAAAVRRAPVRLVFEDGSELPLEGDPETERRVAYMLRIMLPPPPPPP